MENFENLEFEVKDTSTCILHYVNSIRENLMIISSFNLKPHPPVTIDLKFQQTQIAIKNHTTQLIVLSKINQSLTLIRHCINATLDDYIISKNLLQEAPKPFVKCENCDD